MREGKLRWLHISLPPKYFIKKKGHKDSAKAKQLRVVTGKLLASRAAQLAKAQRRAGGWFSLESPALSLVWTYAPCQALQNLQEVTLLRGDQCCFNGLYKRTTSWLTNADFLQVLARNCPGPPLHNHGSLQSWDVEFAGGTSFRTSGTTEYPQGLCEELARSYERALAAAPHNKPKAEVVWREDGCAGEGSKKRKCEDENRDCVGGLRQAHRAVEKLVGWQTVGAELRRCLDTVLQENPHMLHVVKSLGAEPEHKDTDVRLVQSKLASLFKLKDIPRQSGVWSELLQALVRASGDPDHHAATWPKEGAPFGIAEEIPSSGGVFPPVPDSEQDSEAAKLDNWEELRGVDYNYKSYEEHREQADLLFRRELDAGFARASAKREELESEVGPLVPAAIGVVAKAKPGGGHKYRLVHDLRRNGVNAKIKFPERLVLPRLRDAMDDALTLLEHVRRPQERVMWLSLDFKDAFKQLPTRPSERRFLAGQIDDCWFYYRTVLFGVRTGPLVWCRLAALVARATQSLTASSESRLELFIDDPLIALRGSPQEILGCSSCTVAVAGTGPAAGVATGLLGAKGSLDRGRAQRRRKQPNSRSGHPCAEVARVEGDSPDSLGKILGAETSSTTIRGQDVLGCRLDCSSAPLCSNAVRRSLGQQRSGVCQATQACTYVAGCAHGRLQPRIPLESACACSSPDLP